jgi:hypothetical protein
MRKFTSLIIASVIAAGLFTSLSYTQRPQPAASATAASQASSAVDPPQWLDLFP